MHLICYPFEKNSQYWSYKSGKECTTFDQCFPVKLQKRLNEQIMVLLITESLLIIKFRVKFRINNNKK
jgi:hypothetical protein